MPHYAIGDVQGCYKELMLLLDKIHFNEKYDTLWFAGDIINGGLENLSVLRFIYQLPQKPVITLGNHDLHFLAVFYGIRTLQSDDTFADVLNAPDVEALTHWLQSQSLAHYDASLNALMCHAGIAPTWSLADTLTYAKEIETCLNPKNTVLTHEFLLAIFGTQQGEKQRHWRLITDILTRIRFCDENGKLNLGYKGTIQDAPPGFFPWFQHYQLNSQFNKPVDLLFGHWAALEGETDYPHLYALDTGCVWGGKLSALRLEDKQWFQVEGKKYR